MVKEEGDGPFDGLVRRLVSPEKHVPRRHDNVVRREHVVSVLVLGLLHGGDERVRDVPDAGRVKGRQMLLVFLLQDGVSAVDEFLNETEFLARENLEDRKKKRNVF